MYSQVPGGWFHLVVVRGATSGHWLYINGILISSNGSSITLSPSSSSPFKIFCRYSGSIDTSRRLANIFFHAGTAYTTAQVQRLYQETKVYASTNNLSGNDGIQITWKPWSKKVCNPSCTDIQSPDTGLTYYIYRAIEPAQVDLRNSIPWAIKTTSTGSYASLPSSLTGANATAMPLDPLATDSSGNLLCTSSSITTPQCVLVGSVSGSDCNASTPGGCTFVDNANGFSNSMLYNYIMVVRDAEGNYQTPKVQRYRSPYFTGGFSPNSTASFRSEQRWRRASLMLVDELYQNTLASPQVMSYVPMDVSGLDHDFFIHKYETASYDGTVANNSPSGASDWPLQADSSNWVNTAAACQDKFSKTSSFPTECGSGGQVNNTSTLVKSWTGFAPLATIDQGAAWKACRNTGIVDAVGNTYRLGLATDAEWLKAADWGDVDKDGNIDQSVYAGNIGLGISSLESGMAGGCNTNTSSAYSSNSSQTASCRSRYGAAVMVGNVWEWTSGQQSSGNGFDNGVDGLWLGRTLPGGLATTTIDSISKVYYDLLRTLPTASAGAPAVAQNGDNFWINTSGLRGSRRGGDWSNGTYAGRWALSVSSAPSNTDALRGARCSR